MLMLKFDLPRVPISGEGTGIHFFFFSKKIIFILHAKSSSACEIQSKRGGEKGDGKTLSTSVTDVYNSDVGCYKGVSLRGIGEELLQVKCNEKTSRKK